MMPERFLYATGCFQVAGLPERRAYLASLLHGRSFSPGGTLSALIYLENEGSTEIEDFLIVTVKSREGRVIHRERRSIYLEEGEARFLKFNWKIPSDASPGEYIMKAEIEDPDVDAPPVIKRFWIGGLSFIGSAGRRRKRYLLILLLITILMSGCVERGVKDGVEEEHKIITKDPKELALKEEDMSEEWLNPYYIRKGYYDNNSYGVLFRSNKYVDDVSGQRNAIDNDILIFPTVAEAKEAFSDIKKSISRTTKIKKSNFGTESFIAIHKRWGCTIVFRYYNVVAIIAYNNYIDPYFFESKGFNISIAEREAIKYARIVEQRVKEADP